MFLQKICQLADLFQGYSVYKICRNLNRSQNSIRNNLIRLGLIEGEIIFCIDLFDELDTVCREVVKN